MSWAGDQLIINGQAFTARDDDADVLPTADLAKDIRVVHSNQQVEQRSRFQGHAASITQISDVPSIVAKIRSNPDVASATHNIYAFRTGTGNSVREGLRDDGEHGAGMKLQAYLRDHHITNTVVAATRWYGGQHIGPKRFQLIEKTAVDASKKYIIMPYAFVAITSKTSIHELDLRAWSNNSI